MKMKNMIAVLSATAIAAVGMSAMTFSANAADEIAQAYLVGSFGTESNWNAGENAGVNVVSVTGDAQYECTWELAEATVTGDSFFITVVITPTVADAFTTDSYPDLNVTLDEVWVDGAQLSGYDASAAVDMAYYEKDPGVTRVYIRGDWANNETKIIADNTTIESDIKVVFSISGTGAEGESNVTEEESTPDAESSTVEEESSAADTESKEESSKTEESSKAEESSKKDSSSTSSTTTTTNTNTGDAGVAALVAAVAVAGAAVVVTSKKNK